MLGLGGADAMSVGERAGAVARGRLHPLLLQHSSRAKSKGLRATSSTITMPEAPVRSRAGAPLLCPPHKPPAPLAGARPALKQPRAAAQG